LSRAAYSGFWSDPPTLSRHVGRITTIYEAMLARAPQPAAAAGVLLSQAAE